ncbi:MAG: YhgE/Pip family protein [Muricomes sp.]
MQDPVFAGFLQQMNDPAASANLENLKQSTEQLKQASEQVAGGIRMLSDATADIPALKQGITDLQNGLIAAQSGVSQLKNGADNLNGGLDQLYGASIQLADAGKQLSDGAAKVDNGAEQLKGGADKLNGGASAAAVQVNEKISDAKKELTKLNGLEGFAGEPVVIESTTTNPVPNYGTAFAPYFLCLSLWVGALIIFFGIYLDADNKFKVLSRNSDRKMLRSFIYLGIGLAQAVVLGIILRYGLRLQINNEPVYYLACGLISMVFISIVQFLLVHLKDIGKFLAIALLILQLTSCGGTFPMETVPKFFNMLYPFMPMTYAVGLLKEAISGSIGGTAIHDALILAAILFIFMAATLGLSVARHKKEIKTQFKDELVRNM